MDHKRQKTKVSDKHRYQEKSREFSVDEYDSDDKLAEDIVDMISKQTSPRQQFLDGIHRMEKALQTTNSPYLKRDYQKAIKRKYRELRMYDKYQGENLCK